MAHPLECSKLGKQMVGFAFKSPVKVLAERLSEIRFFWGFCFSMMQLGLGATVMQTTRASPGGISLAGRTVRGDFPSVGTTGFSAQ